MNHSFPGPNFRREPGPSAPTIMEHPEKMRVRAAAFRAPKVYPGPVGAVLARELYAWEEFGYRLGTCSVINQLVDHILAAPLPTE